MIGCAPHMRVVDDDPDMRKMVRDYLTPKGCPVSQAVDGVAALVQVAAVAMMVFSRRRSPSARWADGVPTLERGNEKRKALRGF